MHDSRIQQTVHEDRGLATIAPARPLELMTEEAVKTMEQQAELLKRMRVAVCRLTDPSHWIDIGGKPHPTDDAVTWVAQNAGVEFDEPRLEEESGKDGRGEFLHVTCRMSANWRGRAFHDIGTASTRDDFFGKAHGADVAFHDISLGNVRKKAITNARFRLVHRITGIGGMTWELLRQAGITQGAGGSVRHKGNERKMATGSGGWSPVKERLAGLILDLVDGDQTRAGDMLEEITADPKKGYKGRRDPRDLTDAAAGFVLRAVEERYKRARGTEAPADAAPPPGGEAREPGAEG